VLLSGRIEEVSREGVFLKRVSREGVSRDRSRFQRFFEGEIQVNRAPGWAEGQGDGPPSQSPEVAEGGFIQAGRLHLEVGRLHLEESSGEDPEKAELIHGLIAVGIPYAVGPVGGEDQERHLALGCFDHGRV
jgi:hypothetical protein